ncbi:putative transcription factor bHLH family [Helianthus debilis subsp. tardiflorus]
MDFPLTPSQEYVLKEMMMMREAYGQTTSSSSSLVLDSEKGEIVRALVRPGAFHHNYHHLVNHKADKASMALRNHSEAERRRRERINGHLSVLRSLLPGTAKMDKASLLAEVISNLKQLRKTATKATKGVLIPMDIDEVKVEQQDDNSLDESSYSIRASLCCEYKHEVLSDLKEALDGLNLKTIRTEIATLGSRMMNLFVITGSKDDVNIKDIVSSIHHALKSVLDKFYASQEFSESNSLSNKRRRVSFFTPSNSSSLGDFW